MTPTVVNAAIVFVWMFGNLFEPLAWHPLQKLDKSNLTCVEDLDFLASDQYTTILGISVIVELLLPMASIVVCYSIILYKIRKQRRIMGKDVVKYATEQGMIIVKIWHQLKKAINYNTEVIIF